MNTRAAPIFMIFLVFSAGVQAQQFEELTADQILSDIVGSTLTGSRMGMKISMSFYEDGTASMTSTRRSDTGSWEVEDDSLCIQWDNFRGGERECKKLTRNDDEKYRFSPGRLTMSISKNTTSDQ